MQEKYNFSKYLLQRFEYSTKNSHGCQMFKNIDKLQVKGWFQQSDTFHGSSKSPILQNFSIFLTLFGFTFLFRHIF